MSDASLLFRDYSARYASEVNLNRAIPFLEDGLKPVQRRILHVLMRIDDGRFHKVASVAGDVLHFHPHGDVSVSEALVNLTNAKYFIEPQGNFGNIFTGDSAAAPRYIECRILPFAKKVFYSPEITEFIPSYDGRDKEPVVFPAKLPVVLLTGSEGIGYGMSTTILPHNPIEIIDAMKSAIDGEEFVLYPDFLTGGEVDVREYDDGRGFVICRAKYHIDKDDKTIIIDELPYGVTTDTLIESIDKAAKSGKLKVASINDYTADKVSIEIEMAKGASASEELDSLWAFTLAQNVLNKINPLVVENQTHPLTMGVTEIIRYHAGRLKEILLKELAVEIHNLKEKLQTRTLERIFIEERIYKRIEEIKVQEEISKTIIEGLEPFRAEFIRDIIPEDITHLLSLPIRRISLFDIEQNKKEIQEIEAAIQKAEYNTTHIKSYSKKVLDDLKKSLPKGCERKTEIKEFERVERKIAIRRNLSLRFDEANGYLGYAIKTGEEVLKVSEYDKILLIKKDGTYVVIPAPDKYYAGKKSSILYYGLADKETGKDLVFTLVFMETTTKTYYIKRFTITSFQQNKVYNLFPDGSNYKVVKFSTEPNMLIEFEFANSRSGANQRYFKEFAVHGASSKGQILMRREITSIKFLKCNLNDGPKELERAEEKGLLFDASDFT